MENGWTDDLLTKIPWIDTEHKNIIARANEFLESVSQGRGKKEIDKAISLLKESAHKHFATEEKYMQQYKYPELRLHQKRHENYVKVIESLDMEYELQSQSDDLVKKIRLVLHNYLYEHIRNYDIPMAKFFRKRKEETSSQ